MTITQAQIEAGLEARDLWRAATPSERMRAAIEAAERAAWIDPSLAPKDGTLMLDSSGRRVLWCKTPHVPIYGWHWYDAPDPEDREIIHPELVRPLPTPGEPDER